jgi:hypothetical protein
MKLVSLFVAIFYFSFEVLSRKLHRRRTHLCEKGDKQIGEKCQYIFPCGSECREGLTCERSHCLVPYGESCQESWQCIRDHYCQRNSGKCSVVPGGSTRAEMDRKLQQ